MSSPYMSELHETLLRVAGSVPDALLFDARSRLASGGDHAVARIITSAGTRAPLPLLDDDVDLLAELLEEDGAAPGSVVAIQTSIDDASQSWRFTAALSRTADQVGAEPLAAASDDEVVDAVSGEHGLRAVWRAWRWPADGAPYPPPRPVYVVEVDVDELSVDGGGRPGIADRLQTRLVECGEHEPQVEVVAVQDDPPSYQSLARAYGSLVWSADPTLDQEPIVARVFDAADAESGPTFAPDHPKITDKAERARTLGYLRAGTTILASLATFDDVVEPDRGATVPMTFRTDGRWIWPDAVAYYLEEYDLAPDPDLLRHIQAADGPPPRPDTLALQRAVAVLTRPVDEGSTFEVS